MSKEDKKLKKGSKKCRSKRGVMLAFGVTTLGTRVVTAVSLAAIALGFCSISKEAKVFNECIEEVRETSKNASDAVRFCNGG